ncbi:MAG: hypothetical protein M3R38_37620 [Actinomycetota bacterium]|nr:hypothetical protein [Actinomycetota bacterium]
MDHPQLTNTVFGEVFAELLEARSLPVTPFKIGLLAENAGLDGWKVLDRMAAAGTPYAGPLDGLAVALDLSRSEMLDLAHAFTFEERRKAECVPEILSKVNECLGEAIDRLDEVPPETFGGEDDYYKAKGAIAEAGQLVARAQQRPAG